MNRIDELIAEYCPGGVEFRELQDVFTTKNGYTPSKSDASAWSNGTVPWFRMEDIRENGGVLGSSLQLINKTAVKGGRLFPANSILVATSATIGEHALITVPHLSNQRFTSLAPKPEFANRLDMKFVYYYCFVLDTWCRNNTTTSSFASVDMAGFKRFKFPIPPLAVQREIVTTLDEFSKLEAELAAELELELDARRRQYDHYRSLLLVPAHARTTKLGSIATFKYGFTAKAQPSGDYRFLRITDILPSGKLNPEGAKYVSGASDVRDYVVESGDLLMARTGGTFGKTMLVEEGAPAAVYASFLIRIRLDRNTLLPDYYWHFAQSSLYWSQANAMVSTGGQPQFNANVLKRIDVPIPSLSQQQVIVDQLNAFEAHMKDILGELPAELRARRQQYEHYRDRLLTFEGLPA